MPKIPEDELNERGLAANEWLDKLSHDLIQVLQDAFSNCPELLEISDKNLARDKLADFEGDLYSVVIEDNEQGEREDANDTDQI